MRHGLPTEQAHCSTCLGIRAAKTCRERERERERREEGRERGKKRESFLVTSA